MPYEELPLDHLPAERIEALWRYRAKMVHRQLVLPDGRIDLVARGTLTASGRISRVQLAVAGPADRPGFVVAPAGSVTLGVRFHIGWGSACLGLEAASMRNRVVVGRAAEALIGPVAQSMLHSGSLDELQRALMDAARTVSARASPAAGHASVLEAVALLRRGVPISALGARTGTSERTLRRGVNNHVGLSLRTLWGILRFQRAMARLQAGTMPSLGDLAADTGYSDQAHMTREFRRFGAFTPALPAAAPVVEAIDRHPAWP
ncbi:helix-turn-helix domain-containing protein [Variovorax davisae]|uniref:helix-turn-helix domain-containing protein n=1 Tax=Variovorax davisae TaxID=3053515 RepID=UPI00257786F8|nr:helix-turn-helix domain-containing protein [Variovorax sp. J22P271]